MPADQTSFQDRLKKIEQKQAAAPQHAGAPAAAAVAGGGDMPEFGQGPKRESAVGTSTLMIAGGVVGLLALGAVFVRDIMAPPEDITASVMADGAPREVSLLGRILGGSFDPQSVRAQLPIYHLPDAPDGWIRATRSDVRKAFALDKLREQWPAESGGTYVTMDQNPGFKALSKFVQLSQVKTTKTENAAKTQAMAHYLAANGSHLQVLVKFLPADSRLGPDNGNMIWAQHMYATRLGYEKGEAPMLTEFDGQPAIARGNPNLDPTDTIARRVDIAIPFTPNVFVRIWGNASPAEVAKIVGDVNVPGLLAFAG